MKKRYVGLDLFRIVSVIAVCAFHTTIHLGANYGILQSMSQMGAVFMTAFFMLSGYSLFVNYAGKDLEKIQNLKLFWIKRFIGIAPMYYIAAVLYILFNYGAYVAFGFGSYSIANEFILAPIEILGIQSNFHSIFAFSHNGGTWFISCILMCYWVYPLLQEVAKQISTKSKIIIIALCGFVLLYSPFIEYRFNTVGIYASPFFRILEFAIGVMLAALKPQLDKIKFIKKYIYNWIAILLVDIIMIVGVTIAVKLNISVGNYMLYNWVCLPCFIIMLIGLSGVESAALSKSKIVSYCSSIGYVFFLAQLYSNAICKFIIGKFSITNNILIIALGWGVCIIIAVALHAVFEKPTKNWLKKKLKV